MDVELPPDVASGGESGVDVESDVDLPPDDIHQNGLGFGLRPRLGLWARAWAKAKDWGQGG